MLLTRTVSALLVRRFPHDAVQVRGYSEDRDNFDNFGGALLSLFVLVTEENFPEVADPSFTQRPLVRATLCIPVYSYYSVHARPFYASLSEMSGANSRVTLITVLTIAYAPPPPSFQAWA